MFRVRYVCNNVTMTTEDSPPTDIETVHIAYAFFLLAICLVIPSTVFIGLTVNPIIYAFRCPRFRHEAIKILPCFCCKKEEPYS